MKLLASLFVPGVPIPQGSRVAFKHSATGKVVSPERPAVRTWRGTIATFADVAALDRASGRRKSIFVERGPVGLKLTFLLPRPKSAKTTVSAVELAAKRPDIDKLARAVLDALTGVWFRDDSQVCRLEAGKVVAGQGQRSGVLIEFHDLMALGVVAAAPRVA